MPDFDPERQLLHFAVEDLQACEPEALDWHRPDVVLFLHDGLDSMGFNRVTVTADTHEALISYVREFWGDDDEEWFAEYVVGRIDG